MAKLLMISCFTLFIFSSCSHTYYVARHAEKEAQTTNGSSDVPLTNAGILRAGNLKNILAGRKIAFVFATNTIRAKSTAEPTSKYFHLTTEIYGPKPDSAFISLIKSKKKNVLIIGHSNTVDDIVNMLCGEKKVPGDLPDTEYSKLFIIKVKGKKTFFSESTIPGLATR
jgi:phosphohistidine phosphatase SixA